MERRNRFLSRCALGLTLVAAGSACTSARRGIQRLASSHLADTATSYNLAIEQTQDEMLLLNVVRAKENYPLYITDASKVTGTVKADINLGLKIPLVHAGSANANDYFGMPTIDYSSSPAMDVNLLNAKDFMMGFLSPITPEMFAYYWDQGWATEFLLYLLVLRVDEYAETGDPEDPWVFMESFHNHPDARDPDQHDLRGFAEWVHGLVSKGRPLLCAAEAEGTAVGPPIEEQHLEGLKYLVPVAKEGLALSPAGAGGSLTPAELKGRWQLQQPKKAYSLAPWDETRECPKQAPPAVAQPTATPGDQVGNHDQKPAANPIKFVVGEGSGFQDVLTLRSPEGVLYYLGELARIENREDEMRALLIHLCDYNSACAMRAGGEPPVAPLFVALDKQEHGNCNSIIWVRALDGSDYMIPKGKGVSKVVAGTGDFLELADTSELCITGQSMHALDLISQLIGLQKTNKDFTTTSTVKVLGQ